MKIGVIAEDTSDVEVLYELTCKLMDERSFSFKKFVGRGCGKLRSKCSSWAHNLSQRGCQYLVVVHDLDRYKEADLRSQLSTSVSPADFDAYLILIPKRELEAWLLTDSKALKTVFNMPKLPKIPANSENLTDPKKTISRIVRISTRKDYVNTIHNKKIAGAMRISKAKNCVSFRPYPKFISSI